MPFSKLLPPTVHDTFKRAAEAAAKERARQTPSPPTPSPRTPAPSPPRKAPVPKTPPTLLPPLLQPTPPKTPDPTPPPKPAPLPPKPEPTTWTPTLTPEMIDTKPDHISDIAWYLHQVSRTPSLDLPTHDLPPALEPVRDTITTPVDTITHRTRPSTTSPPTPLDPITHIDTIKARDPTPPKPTIPDYVGYTTPVLPGIVAPDQTYVHRYAIDTKPDFHRFVPDEDYANVIVDLYRGVLTEDQAGRQLLRMQQEAMRHQPDEAVSWAKQYLDFSPDDDTFIPFSEAQHIDPAITDITYDPHAPEDRRFDIKRDYWAGADILAERMRERVATDPDLHADPRAVEAMGYFGGFPTLLYSGAGTVYRLLTGTDLGPDEEFERMKQRLGESRYQTLTGWHAATEGDPTAYLRASITQPVVTDIMLPAATGGAFKLAAPIVKGVAPHLTRGAARLAAKSPRLATAAKYGLYGTVTSPLWVPTVRTGIAEYHGHVLPGTTAEEAARLGTRLASFRLGAKAAQDYLARPSARYPLHRELTKSDSLDRMIDAYRQTGARVKEAAYRHFPTLATPSKELTHFKALRDMRGIYKHAYSPRTGEPYILGKDTLYLSPQFGRTDLFPRYGRTPVRYEDFLAQKYEAPAIRHFIDARKQAIARRYFEKDPTVIHERAYHPITEGISIPEGYRFQTTMKPVHKFYERTHDFRYDADTGTFHRVPVRKTLHKDPTAIPYKQELYRMRYDPEVGKWMRHGHRGFELDAKTGRMTPTTTTTPFERITSTKHLGKHAAIGKNIQVDGTRISVNMDGDHILIPRLGSPETPSFTIKTSAARVYDPASGKTYYLDKDTASVFTIHDTSGHLTFKKLTKVPSYIKKSLETDTSGTPTTITVKTSPEYLQTLLQQTLGAKPGVKPVHYATVVKTASGEPVLVTGREGGVLHGESLYDVPIPSQHWSGISPFRFGPHRHHTLTLPITGLAHLTGLSIPERIPTYQLTTPTIGTIRPQVQWAATHTELDTDHLQDTFQHQYQIQPQDTATFPITATQQDLAQDTIQIQKQVFKPPVFTPPPPTYPTDTDYDYDYDIKPIKPPDITIPPFWLPDEEKEEKEPEYHLRHYHDPYRVRFSRLWATPKIWKAPQLSRKRFVPPKVRL